MSFEKNMDRTLSQISKNVSSSNEYLERLRAEVAFAADLAKSKEAHKAEWEKLIEQAVEAAQDLLEKGATAKDAVTEAEIILAPIGEAAKQYTVHCVGHAHIDMNWMWDWPETLAMSNDTFSTVFKLMDEFPDFVFLQSQSSVYKLVKDYYPELYKKIQKAVKDGKWEIAANQWVEGDKNMASGEILCRHILYTKQMIKKEFGLPYDAIKINWEPDTFGHCHTLPTILNQAGIRWYYFCRTGPGPSLFWWQGKDGSRVLAFDDRHQWYLGPIKTDLVKDVLKFEKETSMKDYLVIYGVGDHGGGPTRKDLAFIELMNTWPIYPNIGFSTLDKFYTVAEKTAKNLPVVDAEMGYIFEGCYSSQSNVKYANRKSEQALVEAEATAVLGKSLAKMPYPSEGLFEGWRHAMFNQFHDILPGSGLRQTYEYAQGLFQEVIAQTQAIKTRSLRSIAEKVNTHKLNPNKDETSKLPAILDGSLGGGQGDIPKTGAVTNYGASSATTAPLVVFNTMPWGVTDVVRTRIWDRDWENDKIGVVDESGNVIQAQFIGKDHYWGHNFTDIAFPVKNVPALGYKTYSVVRSLDAQKQEGCTGDEKGVLENEFYKIILDQISGTIVSIYDKKNDVELVPPAEPLGLFEYILEAPHAMTSWVIGQAMERKLLMQGAVTQILHKGPYLSLAKIEHKLNGSKITMDIALKAGSPVIEFDINVHWVEIGTPQKGVPSLRIRFPLAVSHTVGSFETANGHVTRSTDITDLTTYTTKITGGGGLSPVPDDTPAQKWIDLTGKHLPTGVSVGATLVNDCKYGFRIDQNVMSATLIRGSFEPDTLPEIHDHKIQFGLIPHSGSWTPSQSTRAGYEFNTRLNVIGTDDHEGDMPLSGSYVEILTPNVMVSGLKKAEDSDALIIRLYEMEGKQTVAQIRLDKALIGDKAIAVQTDLMEQPIAVNTAKMDGLVLNVELPMFGMTTVKIEG